MTTEVPTGLPDEYRIEQKIPVDPAGLHAFRDWLILHGRGFHQPYPDRLVNSLYFDSPALDCYADNLDGMSERVKLRLRWYGNATEPAQVRLELKRKSKATTVKQVAELDVVGWFAEGLHRLPVKLRSAAPLSFRPTFDLASRPMLWNRYERAYLANRRGIRVTVDTELRAADVLGDRLDPLRLRRDVVHAVIEVKYPEAAGEEVRELLGPLPLRHFRHSKYVSGVGGVSF